MTKTPSTNAKYQTQLSAAAVSLGEAITGCRKHRTRKRHRSFCKHVSSTQNDTSTHLLFVLVVDSNPYRWRCVQSGSRLLKPAAESRHGKYFISTTPSIDSAPCKTADCCVAASQNASGLKYRHGSWDPLSLDRCDQLEHFLDLSHNVGK